MKESFQQRLYTIAENLRRSPASVSINSVFRACIEDGVQIDLEGLREVISKYGRGDVEYFPYVVAKFIAQLIGRRSPKSVLDPSAGFGSLSIPIYQFLRPERFDVIFKNAFHEEVWGHLSEAEGIDFRLGDGLAILRGSTDEYDAIVSCPPFRARTDLHVDLQREGKDVKIRGDYGDLLLLESCRHLAPGGVAVFVVTNSFFMGISDRVRQAMADTGFRPVAAIELPTGTFAPLTNIPTQIIVVERRESERLFTARFSSDPRHQDILLENFEKERAGKTPDQGRIVVTDAYRGFTAIELAENLEYLAIRRGLVAISLSEVVEEIHAPKTSGRFEPFEGRPNAVYLPQMAATKAVTDQKDLPEKLKSYFQLVVNPEVVSGEFLAGFLNSSFGQRWRDTLRSGTTIARISLSALKEATIYLPRNGENGIQHKVVSCHQHLARLKTEIGELETQLWERPRDVRRVEQAIKAINREDRYEDWLETLPFPLASILWSCHTQTGSPKEKYERKLHFFEALAEFVSVVHLSAFSGKDSIWPGTKEGLDEALKQGNVSLKMATFGTWAKIVGYFGKQGRGLLEKEGELVFELYKSRNRDLLACLFSKKLVSVVQDVNKMRNDWSGHTGIVSERDAAQVNEVLAQKIQTVREVIGVAWEEYRLLLPGESRFSGGRFEYKVKEVMGTRTPFPSETVSVSEPMEDGRLYLMDPDGVRGLKLLPFVKVLPSPRTEENACYFYNRSERKGIRFLSYYFEGESEVVDTFDDVALALGMLGMGTSQATQ